MPIIFLYSVLVIKQFFTIKIFHYLIIKIKISLKVLSKSQMILKDQSTQILIHLVELMIGNLYYQKLIIL